MLAWTTRRPGENASCILRLFKLDRPLACRDESLLGKLVTCCQEV